MECNKDEALRAKLLAEEKMLNNDFEGAQKIALKARRLFPELENISQIIAVCDVHCFAQKKMNGNEKDLYGILQVENVADEATIRKQYRKLALVLHPDKNKFPGAEAAFKLIGEANMILSDKGKRSVYDFKCREPVRPSVTKLQERRGNLSSFARTQPGAQTQNKFTDVPCSQFNSSSRPSFWTYCPFCNIKYEYYRDFVNRPLRCQHCSKLFIAYDIGAQGGASGPHFVHDENSSNVGSNRAQPPFFQQKDVKRQEKVKVNIQKDGQIPSHFVRQTWSTTGVQFATKNEDAKVGDSSRTRMKDGQKAGTTKTNTNGKPMEADRSRKRGRKMVSESSESSSDVEAAFGGIGIPPVGSSRRSSRQRQKVSYREDAAEDMQKEQVSDVDKDADVSMPNGKSGEWHKMKGEETRKVDNCKSDSDSAGPVLVDCPDPEFSNFCEDKEEHCFAVDQIWACYDSVDGMPRFYAQVRKIYSSDFRLRITWLEAEPENDLEIKWAEEGLPVGCGKFVRGETEETRDRLMFSHKMVCEKGRSKFSYVIYPQKGEIWALFKDWDIKWSLDPESHRKYKFDIVEILSVHDNGVSVAFLLKVKGFVSVFQRRLAEHKIPTNELFRFSHRIPSVKLSGTERAGVPAGSFELDTASLPSDLEEYYHTNEVTTPKKQVNSDKETLNLRRSPRGSKAQEVGSDVSKKKANDATPSKGSPKLCRVIHDFSAHKQIWRFQAGQIWAYWQQRRQCYAQIKRIESEPPRLHVATLSSILSNTACGLFRVSAGKAKILGLESFSHLVKAEEVNARHLYNIHPMEQEIWGLDSGEIVEVLERDESSVKVMALTRVSGYKSVFKEPKIEKSTGRTAVVPRAELNRFSHQIPAFRFTEEKDGCLRGCWELDPAALA